jgi:carbon monoxide dehydrogenase subunit G
VKLQGDYLFCGPREEVWELVRDPEVLATALPGAQSLNRVSDSEYQGTMKVRIGPVAGAFTGRVVVSDEVPPESYVLTVEGKGRPGWATGSGAVKLLPEADGRTRMEYEGEVQIGGKLANVGQRLIDSVSKSMIRQGLEVLDGALEARIAAKCGDEEVEFKPPSEAKFAASVAKDMIKRSLRRGE